MSNEVLLKNLGDKPSHPSFGFLWADYIEMRCMVSEDKLYSLGQFVDIETEEDLFADDYKDSENETGLHADDLSHARWEDIKRNFSFRYARFGENWPFYIDNDQLVFCFDEENNFHVYYLFLLLCSQLKFCNKKRQGDLTGAFELLGYEAFKSIMKGWVVKPFGAHQNISVGYDGTLAEKFQSLKEDIHPRYVADPEDFDKRDTGDGGLDIIAYLPFDDVLGNIPVAFAQCGCSPSSWDHKQLEASPSSMNNKITPQHPAANYYLMPHDFRDLNGSKWAKPTKVSDVVLLDRQRLLSILVEGEATIALSKDLVKEAVDMNVSYF